METTLDNFDINTVAGQTQDSKASRDAAVKSLGVDMWETDSTVNSVSQSILTGDEGLLSMKLLIDGQVRQIWDGPSYVYNDIIYHRGPTAAKSLQSMLRSCQIPGNCFSIPLFAPIPANLEKRLYFTTAPSSDIGAGLNSPIFVGKARVYQDVVDQLSELQIITNVNFRETSISGSQTNEREINLPSLPRYHGPSHLIIAIDKQSVANGDYSPVEEGEDLGFISIKAGAKTLFEGSYLSLQRVCYAQNRIQGTMAPGLSIFKMPVGDFPAVPFIDGLSVTLADYSSLKMTMQKATITTGITYRFTVYLVSHEQSSAA